MTTHPKNACPAHEWEDSLSEPGTQNCAWCGTTREAPAAPVRGVDFPVTGPVADAVRERAA